MFIQQNLGCFLFFIPLPMIVFNSVHPKAFKILSFYLLINMESTLSLSLSLSLSHTHTHTHTLCVNEIMGSKVEHPTSNQRKASNCLIWVMYDMCHIIGVGGLALTMERWLCSKHLVKKNPMPKFSNINVLLFFLFPFFFFLIVILNYDK